MAVGASATNSHVSRQPDSEEGRNVVLSLLKRAQRSGVRLDCGLSRKIEPRTASIDSIDQSSLILADADFSPQPGELLRVAFHLQARPYCFEAPVIEASGARVVLELPRSVSRGERRSRERARVPARDQAETVTIEISEVPLSAGRVVDISPEGMSLCLPDHPLLRAGADSVAVLRSGGAKCGRIRYKKPLTDPEGWVQLGLELWPSKPSPVSKQDIEDIGSQRQSPPQRIRHQISLSASAIGVALERATNAFYLRKPERVHVVDYSDSEGRPIRGIIDAWGDPRGATAVVIPPAWGRTKETLLPLAHSIVSAFSSAQMPVMVLRFDGIGKRGESYREPAARAPGLECVRMRFSQGVDDIRSAVDFLHSETSTAPSSTFVVSFSAASIEARRAVATDARISGWVCVVGSADLQSMMKRISGGVDYALGIERGVKFGRQEILGVTVDMDLAGRDALDHDLVYMADARNDMVRINVPLTWIYGRSDAWMDVARVEDVLAQGDSSRRRLVGTPMGHMLRSSQEALSIFNFIACEISRMSGGAPTLPSRPALSELARKQRAERARRPTSRTDIKAFWENYLLGGEDGGGYGVLTAIAPFAEFMRAQVEALDLRQGNVVADLGSGTGAFLAHATGSGDARIIEIDLIHEVLRKVQSDAQFDSAAASFVQGDLSGPIPLASKSVDRVMASLFLSYVADPNAVLREIRRVLRPGGRLVASTLIADADMSKLYVEGVQELSIAASLVGEGVEPDKTLRSFANHASRLLDLEEEGAFRFWEPLEFRALLRRTGWQVDSVERAFGSPPQAVVISATPR